MQVLNKQRIKKLAKNQNIELIKGSKKPILNIVESISNGKNIKIELIDSNLRDKCMAYCDGLPFGVLPPCWYLNIETINIISSDAEINK